MTLEHAPPGDAPQAERTPLRLSAVRACRFCGCPEERACPGGCGWAFDDVCTSCVGHTPASWEAFRFDPLADGARPPHLLLISAMRNASAAVALIGEQVAHLQPRVTWREEAARLLAAALGELFEAEAPGGPAYAAAMSAFVFGMEGDADDA